MEKLLKENIALIAIVIILFFAGLYGVWYTGNSFVTDIGDVSSKKQELETKQQNLQATQRKREEAKKKMLTEATSSSSSR